jgi:hypothetical protein
LPDGGYALSGLQHLSAPGFRRPAKRSTSRQSVLDLKALPDGGYALSGLQHLSAPGFRRPAKPRKQALNALPDGGINALSGLRTRSDSRQLSTLSISHCE